MKIRYVSVLLPVVLWGCGTVSLEDMEAPGLTVTLSSAKPGWGTELYISLYEGGAEKDCPNLSEDVKASFNGVGVEMSSAGGWIKGGFLSGPGSCGPTVFMARGGEVFSTVGEDVTRVTLTEGNQTRTAEVHSLCTARTARLVSPASGVVHPGDEVDLEWLPATDEVLVERIDLTNGVGFRNLVFRSNSTLKVEGNHLRFQMPVLEFPLQGAAEFVLNSSVDRPYRHQVSCDGFVTCNFTCWFLDVQRTVPVTIQLQ